MQALWLCRYPVAATKILLFRKIHKLHTVCDCVADKMLSLHAEHTSTMAKRPFIPIPPLAELPPAEEINVRELLDKYLSGEIDLICVLGPTASGKTRYAVQLARQINALLEAPSAEKSLGTEGSESVLPPWPQGEGPTKWEGFFSTPPQPHSTARVLIVGTGGAGKAAAVAAASLGMDLILMNRSMEKAEAVAKSVAAMDPAHAVEVRPLEDFRECFRTADIVIYNIPSAIPALAELSAEDFNPGHHKFILEANYKNPSFDKELIMKMMTANPEATCTKGTTWLLYQALTGYEIFTGEKPDLAPMSAVL